MTAAAPEQAVHRYRPEGSAREVFACRAPEVLLSGPAGTGKSRACLEKMHSMALANPGMRGLIARKTAVSLTTTALVTFREWVAKEALDGGEVRFYGGSRQQAAAYVYGNGSEIVVGGLDKATRIMSSEYDVIYVQEAIELTEDDWESLTTRLRNGKVSFQQLIADTNPAAPTHWLKARCDRGACQLIYCRHEDNPRLWDGREWTIEGRAYMARLDALTGVRYERLRGGRWVAAEGLIYDTFDPAVHLGKPLGMPPHEWPRYLGIDFGYNNPFVAAWFVEDPNGRLHLYREWVHTGMLVEDHAKKIAQLIKTGDGHKSDVMPREIVCDHDAEGRATLEAKLGVSTVAAHKSVLEGIEAVKARLKVQGDGMPRLIIHRDAVVQRDRAMVEAKHPIGAAEEILDYVWADQVVRGGKPHETPVKEGDHSLDALRYVVAAVDLVGRPRVRFMPGVGAGGRW